MLVDDPYNGIPPQGRVALVIENRIFVVGDSEKHLDNGGCLKPT